MWQNPTKSNVFQLKPNAIPRKGIQIQWNIIVYKLGLSNTRSFAAVAKHPGVVDFVPASKGSRVPRTSPGTESKPPNRIYQLTSGH